MGKSGDVAWTTGSEVRFLGGLPELMRQRLDRDPTPLEVAAEYGKYLMACRSRKDWGDMDELVIRAEAARLMNEY